MSAHLLGRGSLLRHVAGNGEAGRGPSDKVFDALHGVGLVAAHRREGTARGRVSAGLLHRGVLLGDGQRLLRVLLRGRASHAEDAVEHCLKRGLAAAGVGEAGES